MAKKKSVTEEKVGKIEDASAKEKALQAVLGEVNKIYGVGTAQLLGAKPSMDIEVIPTGSLGLDSAIGVGGYPRGRIIEIFGAESSGKTTATLHACAECQKAGGMVAFVDAEHALDPSYAKALGVDIDSMVISQPDSGEEALEVTEKFVKSGVFDMVIVDSVAALVPRAELDGNMGDAHMALQARLMSQAMRKLSSVTNNSKTILVFINQLRVNIGAYSPMGTPTTTAGGKALPYYASIRLEVKAGEYIKEGPTAIGRKTKIKVIKNKVAPPFKVAELDMIFGKGFGGATELFSLGKEYDIIARSGAYFSDNITGERIGQGSASVQDAIDNHPKVAEQIERAIRYRMKHGIPNFDEDETVVEEFTKDWVSIPELVQG